MTVYVDELKAHAITDDASPQSKRHFGNGKLSCHLMAGGLDCMSIYELHQFAKKMGLKTSWFQPGSWPHYDLTPRRRERAVELGAIEETNRAGALRRARVRRAYAEIQAAVDKLFPNNEPWDKP